MHELWSSDSYAPHLLSLPFALAPAAMLIVIAYTAVMRGAPILRGFLLAHFGSLLPYAVCVMLAPSITRPAVAEQLFRVAAGFIPMAAATGTGFQLALIGKYRRYRWLVWFALANAAVWIVVGSTSDAAIDGVQRLPGFWYPIAGDWAPLALVHTVVLSAGFLPLTVVALRSPPSDERRQLRATLVANLVTYAGLVDVALAYGIGMFPLGWLLSGIGSLLVVRALVVEDLLRVRAVDTTAPLLVVHFVGGLLLGWVALAQLPRDAPWWIDTVVLVVSFIGVRMTVTLFQLINRGARGGGGPLERLIAQLVARARASTDPVAIAQLAIDIVELGVGVRPPILLASEDDWGWTLAAPASTKTGAPDALPEDLLPDPLLGGWIAEQRDLRVVFADDLEPIPADLHDALRALFVGHQGRALQFIRNGEELIGIIVIPTTAARLRGRQLAFLDRVAERLAEALLHARMAQRASERAGLAREVELAAAVQSELLPSRGTHKHGDITVVGSWQPATRCAGDFWGFYPLDDNRVLIAVGDVTGHGVASAMVTAAVAGACDVCVRRDPQRLDLAELLAALDTAVRRTGGTQLAMTCFAAILDARTREIQFVSCGHPAAYLLRRPSGPGAKTAELHALVARGNPLGLGVPATPKLQQRTLQAGDLVVWYTDGVIEAQDPGGRPYGDRRLQHLLRRFDPAKLAPQTVHDVVQASVAAHRAGRALADDETVVVAQMIAAPLASLELARAQESPR